MDIHKTLIRKLYERDTIPFNAEHNIVHGEVQGVFHAKHQQYAHGYLLRILIILHSYTQLYQQRLFPTLAFSQETVKYSSIIRMSSLVS